MVISDNQIKTAAQLASTMAALVALVFALRSERRNQKRFDEQIKLAQSLARPYLIADFVAYDEHKAIILYNHGNGAAVITNIHFVRGDDQSQDLSELIHLDRDIRWNECPSFGQRREYLASKAELPLLDLTEERLRTDNIPAREIAAILESVEEQLDEVYVHVTYEDVFGNLIGDDQVVG